jgi:catechol 2,3-dioxygenase-like lactoylglutathione lyase family enzyme
MESGSQVAFLECDGGAQLEIVQPAGEVRTPVDPVPAAQVGIKHIALAVDDVDEMYARLTAAGVEYTIPPRDAINTAVMRRLSHARDPDGIVVEFIERAPGRSR